MHTLPSWFSNQPLLYSQILILVHHDMHVHYAFTGSGSLSLWYVCATPKNNVILPVVSIQVYFV